MRKYLAFLGLALLALPTSRVFAADAVPPASRSIPRDAVAVLEVSKPKALLDMVLSEKLMAAAKGIAPLREQMEKPDVQRLLKAVQFLEFQLGTDWRTGIRKLLGGGVTLAVLPRETVLVIVDAEDGEMLQKLHETLIGFAKDAAEKRGRPETVASQQYRGVTGWTFGKNEAHAIIGNRLVLSNRPEAVKAVVDLREAAESESLAGLPAYQEAHRALGEAPATAFVDLALVKQQPAVQKALNKNNQPMGVFLLGGLVQAAKDAQWLGMGLHVNGATLTLEAVAKGQPGEGAKATAFARPTAGDGVLPNLAVPRQIAAVSLYRDMHGFYTAKEELFPERTGGLILFENFMEIFFSGRDLTDEVLAEGQPDIRLVVAEQKYDPAVGTPRVKVPAFAVVLRMKYPEKFREVAEEAWQKALGLTNFTRGQKAEPGLIIDKLTHGGISFSTTHFSVVEEKEKANLDVRFNFRPSLAMPDDYLILSSTDQLACDLIDAVKQEKAAGLKPLAGVDTLAELNGKAVASILEANRESLIRQNMLEKGTTQEEAETQIGIVIKLVRWLGNAKAEVAQHDAVTRARVEVVGSREELGAGR